MSLSSECAFKGLTVCDGGLCRYAEVLLCVKHLSQVARAAFTDYR